MDVVYTDMKDPRKFSVLFLSCCELFICVSLSSSRNFWCFAQQTWCSDSSSSQPYTGTLPISDCFCLPSFLLLFYSRQAQIILFTMGKFQKSRKSKVSSPKRRECPKHVPQAVKRTKQKANRKKENGKLTAIKKTVGKPQKARFKSRHHRAST